MNDRLNEYVDGVDSIGDIEETVREVVTRFDSSALEGTDFAGVTARQGRFGTSTLRGSDFSNADLRGLNFEGARMDKLTYAALKGFGVEPSNVTVE